MYKKKIAIAIAASTLFLSGVTQAQETIGSTTNLVEMTKEQKMENDKRTKERGERVERIKKSRKTFEEMDVNSDSYITVDEIMLGKRAKRTPQEILKMFDANDDNMVSKDEYDNFKPKRLTKEEREERRKKHEEMLKESKQ